MTDKKVNLCRHWKQGLITHLHDVCPFCEIDRLKGERAVLITLMNSAHNVIEAIVPESQEEADNLDRLLMQLHRAINGAIQGLL